MSSITTLLMSYPRFVVLYPIQTLGAKLLTRVRPSSRLLPFFHEDSLLYPVTVARWIGADPNDIASLSLSEVSGGLASRVLCVKIMWKDGAKKKDTMPSSVIVKTAKMRLDWYVRTYKLGTRREARTYSQLSYVRDNLAPKVYHAEWSELTGEYLIIMEDLQPAQSGCQLMGNQCWGPVEIRPGMPDAVTVAARSFQSMADMHATYWRDAELLSADKPWLKNYEYVSSGAKHNVTARAKWNQAHENMRDMVKVIQANPSVDGFETDPDFLALMVRMTAEGAISYDAFLSDFDITNKNTAWTLTHGDCHAGNTLVTVRDPTKVFWVDWSETGIGCPFSELAQYLVSNMTTGLRREKEKWLFEDVYLARLEERGVSWPKEAAWERYRQGGIERWVQLYLILTRMFHLNGDAAKYFHDQVAGFVEDHAKKCEGKIIFRTTYAL
eukprot:PhM_4_TR15527/c0_g1_i1/m.28988